MCLCPVHSGEHTFKGVVQISYYWAYNLLDLSDVDGSGDLLTWSIVTMTIILSSDRLTMEALEANCLRIWQKMMLTLAWKMKMIVKKIRWAKQVMFAVDILLPWWQVEMNWMIAKFLPKACQQLFQVSTFCLDSHYVVMFWHMSELK